MKIHKILSYTTLAFGLIGIIYGFYEYITIGQVTGMTVLAYIAPGFILSALGLIMLFLSKILYHLDGIEKVTSAVFENVIDILGTDEETLIELTDEAEKEG